MAGDEASGPYYSEVVRAARGAGMLQHPLTILAASWRAWLHPRGKDGRFIETFASVDIYADARSVVGDRRASRLRGRITRLTKDYAAVRYFGADGKEVAADPDNGFPEHIPAAEIRDKIARAPHAIARLDAKRDRAMWGRAFKDFNSELRENPPKGQSHNTSGPALAADDPAWEEHQTYVTDVLTRALEAGLGAGEYLRTREGNWNKKTVAYIAEVVDAEIAKVKARGVPQESRAVMLGGVPGSGKTTTAEDTAGVFAAAGLADSDQWATVNPDIFKEVLIARGDIPEISGLSPMEAAPLYHSLTSEMSHIFGRLLLAEGFNVIFDLTMRGEADSNTGLTPPEVEAEVMTGLGYQIDAIFADLPSDIARQRQLNRQLGGVNALRAGADSRGGRVVPPHITRRAADGRSDSLSNFERMRDNGVFARWSVIDTSGRRGEVTEAGVGTEPFSDIIEALKNPENIPGVKP